MAKLFSKAKQGMNMNAEGFIWPVILVIIAIAVGTEMYPVLTNYTDSAGFADIPLVGPLGSNLIPLLYGVLILVAIFSYMKFKKGRR